MPTVVTPRTNNKLPESAIVWPWEYGVVEISTLMIDVYQRPLSSFVEKIVRKWNPYLLMSLCVSERLEDADGQPVEPGTLYAVVDGQTRAEAMNRQGMTHVPCQVYRGMSLPEEAKLFSRIMTERKTMTSAVRFRADVVAKDAFAVALNTVIERAGFFIDPAAVDPTCIRAPASLEWVMRGCQAPGAAGDTQMPELVETELRVIRESWEDLPDTAKNSRLLKGMGLYLMEHPTIDVDKLIRQLQKVPPSELGKRAMRVREGEAAKQGKAMGGDSPRYWAEAIHGQYNSKAR